MSSTTQPHQHSHPHHHAHTQDRYNSQYSSQYLQVPKFAQTRTSRSRSRSRSRQRDSVPCEVFSSPTQVIVSPQKLSFRPRSPEPPKKLTFKPESDDKPLATPIALDVEEVINSPPKQTLLEPPPPPHIDAVILDVNNSRTDTTMSMTIPNTRMPALATAPTSIITSIEDPLGGADCDDTEEKNQAYTTTISSPTELLSTPSLLPPPVTTVNLRQRLIGAWKLESYIAYPTPSSRVQRPTYPMTRNVTGFIMYTPDGYMSAQMLIPGQQSFKRGEGEEPQWAEAGKRCFAYCGPYYITDEGPDRPEILRHTFQCCNLPGWIGDIQVRTHRFEEDGQVLVLGSEEPTEVKGDKRIPVLKWRRVRNNADGNPPPPTPQIKISGPGEP